MDLVLKQFDDILLHFTAERPLTVLTLPLPQQTKIKRRTYPLV